MHIRKLFLILPVITLLLCGAPSAQAAIKTPPASSVNTDPLQALQKTADTSGLRKGADVDVTGFVGRVLGGVLALVGILFLALMVYGGIVWMLARGNSADVDKAKDTIVSAIIGLIVVGLGYAITQFVINLLQQSATAGPAT